MFDHNGLATPPCRNPSLSAPTHRQRSLRLRETAISRRTRPSLISSAIRPTNRSCLFVKMDLKSASKIHRLPSLISRHTFRIAMCGERPGRFRTSSPQQWFEDGCHLLHQCLAEPTRSATDGLYLNFWYLPRLRYRDPLHRSRSIAAVAQTAHAASRAVHPLVPRKRQSSGPSKGTAGFSSLNDCRFAEREE